MKRYIAAAMLGGTMTLGLAGVAHAYTPEEDAVIQAMEAQGYIHAQDRVVENAHNVCARMARGGTSPDQEAASLVAGAHISIEEANLFVNMAIVNLCPQQ